MLQLATDTPSSATRQIRCTLTPVKDKTSGPCRWHRTRVIGHGGRLEFTAPFCRPYLFLPRVADRPPITILMPYTYLLFHRLRRSAAPSLSCLGTLGPSPPDGFPCHFFLTSSGSLIPLPHSRFGRPDHTTHRVSTDDAHTSPTCWRRDSRRPTWTTATVC